MFFRSYKGQLSQMSKTESTSGSYHPLNVTISYKIQSNNVMYVTKLNVVSFCIEPVQFAPQHHQIRISLSVLKSKTHAYQ